MRFVPSLLLTALLSAGAFWSPPVWAGPVDINTADAATLAKELNGIGPARANAIVAYRNEHGPFRSIDDLALVKNMPRKVIESNRELLRIEGGGSSKPAAPRGDAKPAKPAKPAPKP